VVEAEDIDILESAFCSKACEEPEELAADKPGRLLAIPSVQAQACQRHDLHDVAEYAFGHVAHGRKVEAIVLDERHSVLVQLEENVAAAFADQDVPDNVSYVVNHGRTQQMLLRNVNFVETKPLQIWWEQTDRHELVQLRVHIIPVLLLQQEGLDGRVDLGENREFLCVYEPTQHRLRDLVVHKQPALRVLHIPERITFVPIAFADVLLQRLLCVE
jgi:hypothetical protein